MLRWEWNKKIGTVKYTDGTTDNLYKGNAKIIAIHENEDNTYYLNWFSSDKEHMRNMLGLSKGYEGCIDDNNRLFNIESMEIDTETSGIADLIKDIVKSKIDITIKLYSSKKGAKNE